MICSQNYQIILTFIRNRSHDSPLTVGARRRDKGYSIFGRLARLGRIRGRMFKACSKSKIDSRKSRVPNKPRKVPNGPSATHNMARRRMGFQVIMLGKCTQSPMLYTTISYIIICTYSNHNES